MTEQEKRERQEAKQHKRAKRAEKALRNRGFKNFLLVFVGFLMGIIIMVSSVAVFVAVIPVKTYMGLIGGNTEEPPVSENVWDKSLIEALMKVNTYQMKDVPVLKGVLNDLMNGSGLGTIVTIDVNGEGFDDIKFVYSEDEGKTFVGELQRYIKLSSTALGDDFAQLDIFKTLEVPKKDMPTPSDMKGKNPKLFYYLASGSEEDGTAKYERAFTDNGEYANGVNNQTKLYYLSVSEMSLADVTACVADRFGVTTVQSILKCFGEIPEDSTIAKILKDITVGTIGSFSAEEILIKDVLEGGDEFYTILEDATGVDRNEMVLGDLSDITPGNIKIKEIIQNSDTLYKILFDATGVDKENLKIKDLENLQPSNVKLTSVLEEADALYKILEDATGKTRENITVSDLSTIKTNQVKLSSVLDATNSNNDTIYNILFDATGKTSENLVVGDLSSLSVGAIKLSSVLDASNTNNDKIYNILFDATGKASSEITINDLSNLTVTDIKLSRVLEPSSATLIYSILKDATGVNASDIKVGDLQGLSTTNVKLTTVMPKTEKNQKLYTILAKATGSTEEEITIGDLTEMQPSSIKLNTVLTGGNSNKLLSILAEACSTKTETLTVDTLTVGAIEEKFAVGNIKISSLGITSTNSIVNALLSAEVNTAEDPVTVGNIGEKIDGLKISQIFDVECFTKNESLSATGVIYQKSINAETKIVSYNLYTGLDLPTAENDLYYISNGASMWLFMLYEHGEANLEGLALFYTEKQTKYSQLETEFKTASQEMTNATVRQFYDVGLLGFESDYSKIYNLKVKDIIDNAAKALENV